MRFTKDVIIYITENKRIFKKVNPLFIKDFSTSMCIVVKLLRMSTIL